MNPDQELYQITHQIHELKSQLEGWRKKYKVDTKLSLKVGEILDEKKLTEMKDLSLIPLPINLHLMPKYVISFRNYTLSTHPQIGTIISVSDPHLFNFFGFNCLNLHFLHPKYQQIKNLLIHSKDKKIYLTMEVYCTNNSLIKFMIKSVKELDAPVSAPVKI